MTGVITAIRNRNTLVKGSIFLNVVLLLYFTLVALNNTGDRSGSKTKTQFPFIRTLNFVNPATSVSTSTLLTSTSLSTSTFFPCFDKGNRPYMGLRGKYWVLYNYVRATRYFRCHESITYTTHGDVSYLDNLVPLLERWKGPVSIGIYAPGKDFELTIRTIAHFRQCGGNNTLIKQFVTFHLFFDTVHMPIMGANSKKIPPYSDSFFKADCDKKILSHNKLYKNSNGLDYPVNVARNVARLTATTHFVFPSDIELYPSPGLIPDFLEMIRRNGSAIRRPKPKVFVSSIFEIAANHSNLPNTKSELIQLIKSGVAIPFHKKLCPKCHTVPKSDQWLSHPIEPGLRVFHIGKRNPPFQHWEPIYIGTNAEPLYDERLYWEGKSDKMTQGYQLCVLDYEFHILDNAFLIHRPGIKTVASANHDPKKVAAQNKFIAETIMKELKRLYGTRKGCEK